MYFHTNVSKGVFSVAVLEKGFIAGSPSGSHSAADISDNRVSPRSLALKSGEPTTANLTVTPPHTTATGTDVTLTIDVKPSGGGAESNYIVLRLSVVEPVSSWFLTSPPPPRRP